ncbi:MAG: two-component system cell cycle sensor histidine kinase/response regulator CckA [Pseudohongiellaceae bacterium]|jgi:two-component system cell cycle sensor histidine kinase/response regulator CckA
MENKRVGSGDNTVGALFGATQGSRRDLEHGLRLFRSYLTASLVMMLTVACTVHSFLDDPRPFWVVDGIVITLILFCLAILPARGFRTTAMVCVVGFWLIEATVLLFSGGAAGPALLLFPFIVLSAACFWSVRAAKALALATVAWTVAVAWADTAEFLPEVVFEESSVRGWAAMVGCLGVIVALVRAAEGALASLRKDTDTSGQRLSDLIAESADGVILIDAAGRLLSCNRVAESLSGLAAANVEGRLLDETGLFSDEDLALIQPELAAVIDGQSRAPLDLTLRDGEGEAVHVECSLRRFLLDDGEPAAFTTLRNVTLRKRAERRRAELERQLSRSQRLDSIGRLAAGIAHDFNNLLTVIMASSELLIETANDKSDCEWREDANSIRAAAMRAATLTNQLLTFGRRQPLAPEVLDLGTVVCEVSEMLSRLLGETIELVIELQPGVGPVRVDRSQVEQVVVNMALNARDAMPEGGTLTLGVSERRVPRDASGGVPEGHWVSLTVRDTGIGMDRATQARVFDPFFSTKEVGEGTGLGLATVHGFVTQSGGHVMVESAPGAGCHFDVMLPRIEGVPAMMRRTRLPAAPRQEQQGRVLVVEDESRVRHIVRRILESAGYTVDEAPDGLQGFACFQEQPEVYDLLISDVIMPGIGGPELARRAHELVPDLPVLFVSGYAGKELGALGDPEDEGVLLRKPFTAEELLDAAGTACATGTSAAASS